jgi:hypothetical protein
MSTIWGRGEGDPPLSRSSIVLVIVLVLVLDLLRWQAKKGRKDENEHENEDEYDLGRGYPPFFAQWLARIPLVKSWNG